VLVTSRFPSVKALPTIVARVRRVFDLDADIATIDSHLARDPRLAPLIRKRPGLRAPGDWESETIPGARDDNTPSAWRPWHAYAAQTSQDGQGLNPSPCWRDGPANSAAAIKGEGRMQDHTSGGTVRATAFGPERRSLLA